MPLAPSLGHTHRQLASLVWVQGPPKKPSPPLHPRVIQHSRIHEHLQPPRPAKHGTDSQYPSWMAPLLGHRFSAFQCSLSPGVLSSHLLGKHRATLQNPGSLLWTRNTERCKDVSLTPRNSPAFFPKGPALVRYYGCDKTP